MKPRPCAFPLLVLVLSLASSCRAIRIHDLEKRCDDLESRLSAVEAKVEMLAPK